MLECSQETKEIDIAIVKLQSILPPAPKDSVNPHFKSRYADFASCKATAQPHMTACGLAVIQTIVMTDGHVGVQSRLIHVSGQWYQGTVFCIPRSVDAQGVGAAATYLKRYGFCALIGLVAEEDDDGNASSKGTQKLKEMQQERQRQAGVNYPKYDKTNQAMRDWLKAQFVAKKWPADTWNALSDLFVGREMSDVEFEKFSAEQE